MATKQDILVINSTVQNFDVVRRKALSEKYNLIYYDCESTEQFKERLKPGGLYSNIVAILRNGWLKAGPLAQQRPFATDVVPHFPRSLKIICCSGHGHDASDVDAITARGVWHCNTPNACTEAVANVGLSLVLDSFRFLTFAQWCARYDRMQSRDLGTKAVDPTRKTLGVVGLGDIGLAIAQKCEAAFQMKMHHQGPRRKIDAERSLKYGAVYHATVDEMIPQVDCIVLAAPYTKETHKLISRE